MKNQIACRKVLDPSVEVVPRWWPVPTVFSWMIVLLLKIAVLLLVVLRGKAGGVDVALSSCDRAKAASPSRKILFSAS